MSQTIKAWSHSALSTYESCPFRAKLAKIDKIPEPERPAPPNGSEHANDRGSRIHDWAEAFVRGQQSHQIQDMQHFKEGFNNLRTLFRQGKVTMEDMWCFSNVWNPVAPSNWEETWVRIKLDAMVHLTKKRGVVIDYKTGKKFGNEIKHGEQGQLYQLAAFLRYPELEEVIVEFWYLDKNELTQQKYTRQQGVRFLRRFDERGTRMTTDAEFKPKPSRDSCMFCPYGPKELSNKWVNKSGDCPHGVN